MALNRIVFFVLLLLLLAGLRVEGNFPFEQVAAEMARNSYTRDRLLALERSFFGAPWIKPNPLHEIEQMSMDQLIEMHNGSVATLEDWFDARRLSDDYVPTAFDGVGGKARAVKGHTFGLGLWPSDRRALIAFLRTL
jgi:hypothetical protein